jgi:hypothetical protein
MRVKLLIYEVDSKDDAIDYESLGIQRPKSEGSVKIIDAHIRSRDIESVWVHPDEDDESGKIMHIFTYNDPGKGLPVKYTEELEKEIEEELNSKR